MDATEMRQAWDMLAFVRWWRPWKWSWYGSTLTLVPEHVNFL
jgi:hypothetical protein